MYIYMYVYKCIYKYILRGANALHRYAYMCICIYICVSDRYISKHIYIYIYTYIYMYHVSVDLQLCCIASLQWLLTHLTTRKKISKILFHSKFHILWWCFMYFVQLCGGVFFKKMLTRFTARKISLKVFSIVNCMVCPHISSDLCSCAAARFSNGCSRVLRHPRKSSGRSRCVLSKTMSTAAAQVEFLESIIYCCCVW